MKDMENTRVVDGLVSIIMPSWNTEKFIAETIQSVLDQTYTNWELLIAHTVNGQLEYLSHRPQ